MTQLQPAADVVSRQLDEQTVLVKMGTNRIFELNRTGARMWELLQEGATEPELVAQLGAEFDVSKEQLEGEVQSLVESLLEEGLISPETQGG